MQPVYLSATQIDNCRRCPRRWAWEKIEGIETPKAQSLELGSRVHDILEAFYQGKGSPDLRETWRFSPESPIFYPGEIASSMISNAIPAGAMSKLHAEMMFTDKTIGAKHGIIYVGKIDVHWLADSALGRLIEIVDHKTSSDPKAWGKKEEDLKNDVQNILYSRAGLEMYSDADAVRFTLNYGSTKLQKSKNYHCSYTIVREQAIEVFEREIEPIAIAMAEWKRAGVHPLELEPNPDACGDFRGCPHRERCELSTEQRIKGLIMSTQGSLVERLKAKAKAGKAETVEEGINPPEKAEEKKVEEKEVETKNPDVGKAIEGAVGRAVQNAAEKVLESHMEKVLEEKPVETKKRKPKKKTADPVDEPIPYTLTDKAKAFATLRESLGFLGGATLVLSTSEDATEQILKVISEASRALTDLERAQ
jgi:DNA-binding FrmR family transcriptional regulator